MTVEDTIKNINENIPYNVFKHNIFSSKIRKIKLIDVVVKIIQFFLSVHISFINSEQKLKIAKRPKRFSRCNKVQNKRISPDCIHNDSIKIIVNGTPAKIITLLNLVDIL